MTGAEELPEGWEKVNDTLYAKLSNNGDTVAFVEFGRRRNKPGSSSIICAKSEHGWRTCAKDMRTTLDPPFDTAHAAIVFYEMGGTTHDRPCTKNMGHA